MSNRPPKDADDEFDDDFDDASEEVDEADDDDFEEEAPAAPSRRGGRDREPAPARGRAAKADDRDEGHGPVGADGAIRITDNPSKWFVIGTIAIFVLILLNGMILGVGGLATPIPTPTPVVTPAPTVKASATPRATAGATATPAASAAASAAPGATP